MKDVIVFIVQNKRLYLSYFILILSLLVNLVGVKVVHAVNFSELTQINELHTKHFDCLNKEVQKPTHHTKHFIDKNNGECCDDHMGCIGSCEQCINISLSIMLPINQGLEQKENLSTINPSFTQFYPSNISPARYRPPIS